MATSYTNVSLTSTWVDLTVANSALASVPILVQNRSSSNEVFVFFGGASAPAANDGVRLGFGESVDGTAANVWAKARSSAIIYTGLKD